MEGNFARLTHFDPARQVTAKLTEIGQNPPCEPTTSDFSKMVGLIGGGSARPSIPDP